MLLPLLLLLKALSSKSSAGSLEIFQRRTLAGISILSIRLKSFLFQHLFLSTPGSYCSPFTLREQTRSFNVRKYCFESLPRKIFDPVTPFFTRRGRYRRCERKKKREKRGRGKKKERKPREGSKSVRIIRLKKSSN